MDNINYILNGKKGAPKKKSLKNDSFLRSMCFDGKSKASDPMSLFGVGLKGMSLGKAPSVNADFIFGNPKKTKKSKSIRSVTKKHDPLSAVMGIKRKKSVHNPISAVMSHSNKGADRSVMNSIVGGKYNPDKFLHDMVTPNQSSYLKKTRWGTGRTHERFWDKDGDGVIGGLDCEPYDSTKHGWYDRAKNWKKGFKSDVEIEQEGVDKLKAKSRIVEDEMQDKIEKAESGESWKDMYRDMAKTDLRGASPEEILDSEGYRLTRTSQYAKKAIPHIENVQAGYREEALERQRIMKNLDSRAEVKQMEVDIADAEDTFAKNTKDALSDLGSVIKSGAGKASSSLGQTSTSIQELPFALDYRKKERIVKKISELEYMRSELDSRSTSSPEETSNIARKINKLDSEIKRLESERDATSKRIKSREAGTLTNPIKNVGGFIKEEVSDIGSKVKRGLSRSTGYMFQDSDTRARMRAEDRGATDFTTWEKDPSDPNVMVPKLILSPELQARVKLARSRLTPSQVNYLEKSRLRREPKTDSKGRIVYEKTATGEDDLQKPLMKTTGFLTPDQEAREVLRMAQSADRDRVVAQRRVPIQEQQDRAQLLYAGVQQAQSRANIAQFEADAINNQRRLAMLKGTGNRLSGLSGVPPGSSGRPVYNFPTFRDNTGLLFEALPADRKPVADYKDAIEMQGFVPRKRLIVQQTEDES